jgi:hypothetical protein
LRVEPAWAEGGKVADIHIPPTSPDVTDG